MSVLVLREIRLAVMVLTLIGALAANTGCMIISAQGTKRCPETCPPSPRIAEAPPLQYRPYAAALDRVVQQQVRVQHELERRDWSELSDELSNWQQQIRRLAGVADSSHDPQRLRDHCTTLSDHLQLMRQAERARDAEALWDTLEAVDPVLTQISHEFPLTAPNAPASQESSGV